MSRTDAESGDLSNRADFSINAPVQFVMDVVLVRIDMIGSDIVVMSNSASLGGSLIHCCVFP